MRLGSQVLAASLQQGLVARARLTDVHRRGRQTSRASQAQLAVRARRGRRGAPAGTPAPREAAAGGAAPPARSRRARMASSRSSRSLASFSLAASSRCTLARSSTACRGARALPAHVLIARVLEALWFPSLRRAGSRLMNFMSSVGGSMVPLAAPSRLPKCPSPPACPGQRGRVVSAASLLSIGSVLYGRFLLRDAQGGRQARQGGLWCRGGGRAPAGRSARPRTAPP